MGDALNLVKTAVENENRREIFRTLFDLDQITADTIFGYGQEKHKLYDRCMYARQFGVECSAMRLLIDYDRYAEAHVLIEFLEGKVNFGKFSVLDYGSGAGDYGVCFGILGSKVTFLDLPEMIVVPKLRCKLLGIGAQYLEPPCPIPSFDLVIFSEVLEHLEDPLAVLTECRDRGVKYLWTTAYPYVPVESEYFAKSGHTPQAHEQVVTCQKFLADNYVRTTVGKWHLLVLNSA